MGSHLLPRTHVWHRPRSSLKFHLVTIPFLLRPGFCLRRPPSHLPGPRLRRGPRGHPPPPRAGSLPRPPATQPAVGGSAPRGPPVTCPPFAAERGRRDGPDMSAHWISPDRWRFFFFFFFNFHYFLIFEKSITLFQRPRKRLARAAHTQELRARSRCGSRTCRVAPAGPPRDVGQGAAGVRDALR